jgi:hypothetical protein
VLFDGRYYNLEYQKKKKQYPWSNKAQFPNAAPSTELHRSETKVYNMGQIFI